ncbi:hypothetical protein VTP01DRAFT_10452 [Rhizomucor pusillus]|uniref:uncharacterized protein n=1 Tax=Rhizomucor pusillus TaxID=4840 RepID=UPI003742EBE8
MTPEETFQKGVEFREQGNAAFKSGDLKAALSSYYSALLHLRSVGGMHPEGDLKQRSESQQVMIYNNMAAALAKQEKWDRALDSAKKASALDPENLKSKFRMGQAYVRLGDFEKAKPLLDQVLARNPDDTLVKQELAKVKQEEKKANAEVKSAYWGMFSNDKKKA